MIIVTGGAGFIGSALIWKLNEKKIDDILVVDEMRDGPKWQNLVKRRFRDIMHKDDFLPWLDARPKNHGIEAIFHMGACSWTTEQNMDYLVKNNVYYSQRIWEFCVKHKVPMIYASSAATYGAAESGFSDEPKKIQDLRPTNKYGYSKQLFDAWVLKQKSHPPFWCGLKFFNVYGPQEYHKSAQASVVFHAFPQVRDKGVLKLFKSDRPEVKDGDQRRDFVYVKDLVDVMYHLLQAQRIAVSGIYNLGSGKARTFIDLGRAVFKALGHKKEKIEWIDTPISLKAHYQYFTEADLDLLRKKTGYKAKMTSLEEGVLDYVQNYLVKDDPFL